MLSKNEKGRLGAAEDILIRPIPPAVCVYMGLMNRIKIREIGPS
ncbi:MAG: hypothetical protein WBF33_04505 [Candidatus Nitrosopolaris sp.]